VSGRVSTRLAWALWAISVALVGATLVFVVLDWGEPVDTSGGASNAFINVLFVLLMLAFPTVGAVVASRQPGNAIGWTFCAIGPPLAFSSFAHEYAVHALITEPGSLPGGHLMAWFANWLFLPPLFAATPLLFLLFPDGHFLGRRWRVFGWLVALGIVLMIVSSFRPGLLEEPPFEEVVNPVGIESTGGALDVVGNFVWLPVIVSVLGSAVSIVVRFRRSRTVERQQLKWIAAAAALFALAVVGNSTAFAVGGEAIGQFAIIMAFGAIPVAAGYAILRHRLYDIDVVINRTLVYGSLTALLAGTYFGFVLLFQLALNPLTEENELAIAASTLAVAALFRPARRRIQALVDRRFYRRKYDAAQTLESFAARLRAEIDLDALRGELTGVVRETIQPAHVSLWLRGASR
jgi:hypothetical protein